MVILAIDTSCDETACAVGEGRRILSSVVYSQVLIQTQWGGVVPTLAKRAHEERIDGVIEKTLRKFVMRHHAVRGARQRYTISGMMKHIDAVAVTYGPGLAIALEVGIRKAKELCRHYNLPLIGVNHMEGHLYSPFVQNSAGNPARAFTFPYLGLLASGAHTELVIFKNHLEYELLGETLDDAAGEAIDKLGRLLGLGYPAGPAMERLAEEVGNSDNYRFPRPMQKTDSLDFSFSGLKTAFFYKFRSMSEEEASSNIKELASSFMEAVYDSLLMKLEKAVVQTGISRIACGGGVMANRRLRLLIRRVAARHGGSALFPAYQYLNSDNAAMIAVAASYKTQATKFITDIDSLDRVPRLRLS